MFGDTVKRIRKEAGLQQIEFARIIGCSQGYLSRMEREHHMPSHGLAMRLIKFAKQKKIKIKMEDFYPG